MMNLWMVAIPRAQVWPNVHLTVHSITGIFNGPDDAPNIAAASSSSRCDQVEPKFNDLVNNTCRFNLFVVVAATIRAPQKCARMPVSETFYTAKEQNQHRPVATVATTGENECDARSAARTVPRRPYTKKRVAQLPNYPSWPSSFRSDGLRTSFGKQAILGFESLRLHSDVRWYCSVTVLPYSP